MKKIVKKVAMILIIILLANSFTSCTEEARFKLFLYFIGIPAAIGLVVALIHFSAEMYRQSKKPPRRTNPYLEQSEALDKAIRSLPKEEYDSMMKVFETAPEKELHALRNRFYSMSTAERISLMGSFNSYSEEEFAVLVKEFNSMREGEFADSLRYYNSLPRTVPLINIVENIEIDVSEGKVYERQVLP
jgi:hypothetical protein